MSPAPDAVGLVDHALTYAASGLAVFPLKADKTPYTEHGMKEATTDDATITSWWRRWPGALIGARIPADMVVLDIDVRHGGGDTIAALENTHAPLDVGRWHSSGRGDGGRHLWFRRPDGKLSVRRLNDWARDRGVGHQAGKRSWSAGIDVLHHGHRYTILPPSPHNVTGKAYTWGAQGAPGPMPSWLAHLVTIELEQPAPLRLVGDADSIADWFSTAHSWHDLLPREGWQLVEGDGDGDGSKWRHPNASAEYSSTVKHGCLFVYTPNTDFPVTEDGDPNGVTRFRAWAILEHDGDLKTAARAAYTLRDGDMEPWRIELEAQARKEPPGPTVDEGAPDVNSILIDWDEFFAEDHQAEDWLIEPIIPRGRAVAIYAPGGTGKSLLALFIAVMSALGRPIFGRTVKPCHVLYLDYEMTRADLAERLESMGVGPEDAAALRQYLHYALLPAIEPLDTRPGARTVVELAAAVDADLVVIDTFARAVAGDENEADTVREFYRHTGVALKAAGRAWCRIDHSGKDVEKGARGTSAKRDDVDVVWQMLPVEGGLRLKATKRRMSWVPETLELVLVEDEVLEFLIPGAGHITLPAGAGAVADFLDGVGAALDVSSRQATALLKDHGTPTRRSLVLGALKFRRDRAARALEGGSRIVGTTPSDEGREPLGNHLAKDQVSDLGTTWEPPEPPLRPDWEPVVVPIREPPHPRHSGTTDQAPINLLTDWDGEST